MDEPSHSTPSTTQQAEHRGSVSFFGPNSQQGKVTVAGRINVAKPSQQEVDVSFDNGTRNTTEIQRTAELNIGGIAHPQEATKKEEADAQQEMLCEKQWMDLT